MLKIKCSFCEKEFERYERDVVYRQKQGMRNYCSLICVGKQNNSQLEKPPKGVIHPNLIAHTTGKLPLTNFRYFLRSVKGRRSKKECSITLEDLLEQWDKQNGICPYTGWEMDNSPRCSVTCKNAKKYYFKQASLDRIDSSKGYIKSNIQFICLIAQYAKNQFKNEELFEFCSAVTKTQTVLRFSDGEGI